MSACSAEHNALADSESGICFSSGNSQDYTFDFLNVSANLSCPCGLIIYQILCKAEVPNAVALPRKLFFYHPGSTVIGKTEGWESCSMTTGSVQKHTLKKNLGFCLKILGEFKKPHKSISVNSLSCFNILSILVYSLFKNQRLDIFL